MPAKKTSPWEERSRQYNNDISGVLFKGFPQALNHHFHKTHINFIGEAIEKYQPKSILDAGCGYGRISMEILNRYPSVKLSGIDISEHYCSLYRQNTGMPAYAGDISDISGLDQKFDMVLCITVMMYSSPDDIGKNFKILFEYLNNNGILILIEPSAAGKKFTTLYGLLNLFKTPINKNSDHCFNKNEIISNCNINNAEIKHFRRNGITTLLIFPLYFITGVLKLKAKWFLKLLRQLDKLFGNAKLPSIHYFYVIRKKTENE